MNTLIQRFVAFYAFINNDNRTIRRKNKKNKYIYIYTKFIYKRIRVIIIKSSYNSYLSISYSICKKKYENKRRTLKNFTTN